jgi:hypothetical protein
MRRQFSYQAATPNHASISPGWHSIRIVAKVSSKFLMMQNYSRIPDLFQRFSWLSTANRLFLALTRNLCSLDITDQL